MKVIKAICLEAMFLVFIAVYIVIITYGAGALIEFNKAAPKPQSQPLSICYGWNDSPLTVPHNKQSKKVLTKAIAMKGVHDYLTNCKTGESL